jgi:hypothetical protein
MHELLDSTAARLQETSDANVREYRVDNNRIVRVTFSGDHDGLELTFIDKLADGNYGVATTYDNVGLSYVVKQDWYKSANVI